MTLVLAFPSIAATTCPRCYGLVPVEDGLYAEPDVSDVDRQRLVSLYREANQRVTDFYGERRGRPIVLACSTPECYSRVGGGGERGVAVLGRAVMLSPRGLDPVIAAHELSHTELHARLGSGQVPQWFDEGLAVLVADDPRFLLPRTSPDRCRTDTQEPLPQTLDEWLRAASADEQMYGKAACRVHRWAAAHGGPRAVVDLLDRLSRGERFTG
ncbi:hypothetical protein SAMN04489726_3505 [Allokutzneria albata]|uniref:Peptidase MA superfamily protein n=1 Tax=Allokutzneria albata TaxID=211114 RepID=A0A1G9WCP1_ALLAB|nr:hypothetical protein SAMN04489726_3505 [Allokutzneria albata]